MADATIYPLGDMVHWPRIGGRALHNRLDELSEQRDEYIEACVPGYPEALDDPTIHDAYAADWAEQNPNESAELVELEEAIEYIEGYTNNGTIEAVTLIAEVEWIDFVKEDADSREMRPDTMPWPFNHVDWKSAGEEMKEDYTEVVIRGKGFWFS